MSDEEKFRRHLGGGTHIKLKLEDGTEDDFILKPLGIDDAPKLLAVYRKLQGAKEDNFFEKFDEETTKKIIELIVLTLRKSYPDISEELLKDFAVNNFFELMNTIFEINDLGGKKMAQDEKVLKRIEAMKQKQKE